VAENPVDDGPSDGSVAASPTETAGCPETFGPPTLVDAAASGGEDPDRSITLGPQPVTSAAVTADYRFEGSLESSVGTAPGLVELPPEQSVFSDEQAALGPGHTALRFTQGDGLSLAPTAGTVESESYTIEMLFSLHELEGWRKLVDLENGSDDTGLYSFDGCLSFFDTAVATEVAIERNAYAHVVLTRDASATVVGYVDGIRQFAFHDRDGLAAIDSNTLRFFVDDTVTGAEESGGAVARIRLYDGPLTANEVAGLACAELPDASCSLTWLEYIAEADAICQATGERYFAATTGLDFEEIEDLAVWSAAAARHSEEALAELYTLPPPRTEQARLLKFYSILERQTDVLRRQAAAAAAGAAARVERLGRRRVELTHEKDSVMFSLQRCPVPLPA
jgi:hypothetical protein